MTEIDIDYWMQGVELPQIRGRVILELLDLMDGEYQRRDWIEKDKKEYVENDDKDTRFDANIYFCYELFEDLSLEECVEGKEEIEEHIGYSLKTLQEAAALYKFAEMFYKFYYGVRADRQGVIPTNEAYLSSPYLEPMRQAAGEAFKVFMANEKDNHEFCEFIAKIEAERKAIAKYSSP
jgi:hypothetical protein